MMIRIPDYIGIDGKALPPAVRSFEKKRRQDQDTDDFQKLLEAEMKKLDDKEDI